MPLKFLRLKVLGICCFGSAIAAFAASPAWELAPPDAKILVGFDVRSLRNSPMNDAMTSQMRAQMQAQMQALALLHVPGIELLDDVDSVFLAATGDMFAPSRPAGAKVENTAGTASALKSRPAFLVAVSGTFPDEHLRPLLKGPHPSYRGINVYRGTGPDAFSVAILDEHTVLMGDDKSIYRAIDRKATGAAAEGPLLARARELAAANDVWMVARDESGKWQKSTGPGAMFASEIEGLDLGLAMREGFHLDIGLATKTEAGAQMFSQLLMTQLQSAINSKMDAQKIPDFWKNVKVGAEGNRMKVEIAMTKEELQESIRLMQEQQAAQPSYHFATRPTVAPATASDIGTKPSMASTPAITATQPPVASSRSTLASSQPAVVSAQPVITSTQTTAPPKQRVVKIYGLDDGVHEVHLDH
jgi:hypothetical protein